MSVVDELTKAFKEMTQTEPPASYQAAGKPVRCAHCASATFVRSRVLARGPLAYTLVCTACGLAMWFDRPPDPARI